MARDELETLARQWVPPFVEITELDKIVTAMRDELHAADDMAKIDTLNKWIVPYKQKKDKAYETITTVAEADTLLRQLIYYYLNTERYDKAAEVLFPTNKFSVFPRFTQMIFDQLKNSEKLLIMGASSCSKSYTVGVWCLLDYWRDPEDTCVEIYGPNEKQLQGNLFSHLKTLHNCAIIKMPGDITSKHIGSKKPAERGLRLKVVSPGRSGTLQGLKAHTRTREHPVFGRLGRIRVVLEEAESIPEQIWGEVTNIVANKSCNKHTFKIMGMFNPKNRASRTAERAEPEDGWKTFDLDNDEQWVSKSKWNVVRLDALRSENFLAKKEIYSGIATVDAIEAAIAESPVGSHGYYTFVRGAYPLDMAEQTLIPASTFDRSKGTFIFVGETQLFAAFDPALEGGDIAALALGSYGLARGWREAPTSKHPAGIEHLFKDPMGNPILRPGLEVRGIVDLPPGDANVRVAQIKSYFKDLQLRGENFLMDTTGNGAPIFDFLKTMVDPHIGGLSAMENATETKVCQEDTKTCKELYDRACTELWFALKSWMMFDAVKIHPVCEYSKLEPQVVGRQYSQHKRLRVESKRDFRLRLRRSPDGADALCLLVQLVRNRTGARPSMNLQVGGGVYNADQPLNLSTPSTAPNAAPVGPVSDWVQELADRDPFNRFTSDYIN